MKTRFGKVIQVFRQAPTPSLRKLSLSARLHVGFSLVLVLVAIVGALSWLQTNQLLDKLRGVTQEDFRRTELTFEMQECVDATLLSVSKMAQSSDPEDVKFEVSNLLVTRKRYEKAAASLEQSLGGRSATTALKDHYRSIQKAAEQAFIAIDAFSKLASGGSTPDELNAAAASSVQAPQDQWIKTLADLRKEVSSVTTHATQDAYSSATTGRAVIALVVVAALFAGVVTSFLISRSVTLPLREAVALSRRVASGDLSADVRSDRTDEIGALLHALGDMQNSLRALLGDIGGCAETIRIASAEVAAGNVDLSDRTETTSSRLEATACDLERLTDAVKQGAMSADRANGLAETASSAAQRGGHVVREVVKNMDAIQKASRKIADIIGVIDGIAFQTNILALNAAVEAARAGEQGRGFAVVAAEVRGLAQRSAEAAKEIKALIGASVTSVGAGTELVNEAGSSMARIVEAVAEVRDVIGRVSASSTEQSGGIEHVNESVALVEKMTQQNAALVEQSAAASESLRSQALRLNELIGTFRLSVSGEGSSTPAGVRELAEEDNSSPAQPRRESAT